MKDLTPISEICKLLNIDYDFMTFFIFRHKILKIGDFSIDNETIELVASPSLFLTILEIMDYSLYIEESNKLTVDN